MLKPDDNLNQLSSASKERGVDSHFINQADRDKLDKAVAVQDFGGVKKILLSLYHHNGDTLVHIAARECLLQVLQFLLDKDPDAVKVQNSTGYNSLHVVIWERKRVGVGSHKSRNHFINEHRMKVVTELVRRDPTIIEAQTKDGQTPLHLISRNQKMLPDIVLIAQFLLEQDANKEAKDRLGRTPLHIATEYSCLPIISLLLGRGANKEAVNSDGSTPLYLVKNKNPWDKNVWDLLLDAGANVNVKNNEGRMLLHIPTIRDSVERVKSLLNKNVNVNAIDNDGNTPLHKVMKDGAIDVCRELLDAGANVNVKNNEGNTPLHIAVIMRDKKLVDELLARGANVNVKNNEGKTPLKIAKDKGYKSIADVIKKYQGMLDKLCVIQ